MKHRSENTSERGIKHAAESQQQFVCLCRGAAARTSLLSSSPCEQSYFLAWCVWNAAWGVRPVSPPSCHTGASAVRLSRGFVIVGTNRALKCTQSCCLRRFTVYFVAQSVLARCSANEALWNFRHQIQDESVFTKNKEHHVWRDGGILCSLLCSTAASHLMVFGHTWCHVVMETTTQTIKKVWMQWTAECWTWIIVNDSEWNEINADNHVSCSVCCIFAHEHVIWNSLFEISHLMHEHKHLEDRVHSTHLQSGLFSGEI